MKSGILLSLAGSLLIALSGCASAPYGADPEAQAHHQKIEDLVSRHEGVPLKR